MLLALTLVSPDPDALAEAGRRCGQALVTLAQEVKPAGALGPSATDWLIDAEATDAVRIAADYALHDLPVDVCVQPVEGRRKRLFLADMDSTIIGCECLDELADYAGVKPQVSAITERAMRGEIPFEAALRERVAKLAGLPVDVLDRCRRERVLLNPGARTLVRTMAANGAHTVLVSGGFDAFTGPVAEEAGFHAHYANRLRVEADRLTGEVAEPILGRDAKLETLKRYTAQLEIGSEHCLAVGDGANDLAMIEAAGLGVAYRAKPVVAARAGARVNHADLTALLYFQGYTPDAFVS